jgi:4-cresol dehydrogenase (hydroxylating) flavoprotein subunit
MEYPSQSIDIESTLPFKSHSATVFTPNDWDDVALKVKSYYRDCPEGNISFYSTGNNWGYGDRISSEENDLLIDLREFNQIIEFDSYHGLITLSPGVTYSQLANFLEEKGDEWIAPVHGGGPDCSVLGNALERGYGLTPFEDHFASVMSLEAILKSGEIYEGPLKRLGQGKLDKLFKFGIGPYTDGLFSQSGLGIVKNVTIRLAKKPEYIEMFYFGIKNEEDFSKCIQIVKDLKMDLGSLVGGINLINRERTLSMICDYPKGRIEKGLPLDSEFVKEFSRKNMISPWLIVGSLHGEKSLVKSAKKILKKRFGSIKKNALYYNNNSRKFLLLLHKYFSNNSLLKQIPNLDLAFQILQGKPNNLALKLAYWKNPNKDLALQENLDPRRDRCGLIWYAPLIELSCEKTSEYVEFMRKAADDFGMNPLITLSVLDELCIESPIPVLFNKESEEDVKRAKKYFSYLLEEGAKKGFFPYRMDINTQKKYSIQYDALKGEPINKFRYS